MRYKNNPGNIRYNASLAGVIGNDNGFCQFKSLGFGLAAILTLLNTYYTNFGLNTIYKILNRYAPPVENQTLAYANFVSQKTGFGIHETLQKTDLIKLIPPIIQMETQTILGVNQIASEIQNKNTNNIFVYWFAAATFALVGYTMYYNGRK